MNAEQPGPRSYEAGYSKGGRTRAELILRVIKNKETGSIDGGAGDEINEIVKALHTRLALADAVVAAARNVKMLYCGGLSHLQGEEELKQALAAYDKGVK